MNLPPAIFSALSGNTVAGKIMVTFYWAILFLAILNYGAVQTITVSIACTATFLLLGISLILCRVPVFTRSALTVSALLLGLLILWVFFQITPLPGEILSHPAWRDVSQFTPQASAVISLTPGDDTSALLKAALPFGIFMIGLTLFDTDDKAERAFKVLAIGGGLIATLSLLQFLLLPNFLVFGEKRYYLDSLTTFFVNRNTAATLLGLTVLCLFTLVWQTCSKLDVLRIRVALELEKPLPSDQLRQIKVIAFYGFLLGASLLALMLTKSRAGVGSSFAGLMLLSLLMASGIKGGNHASFKSSKRRKLVRRLVASVISVAFVSIVFAGVAGQTMLRAQIRGADDGRFCIMPGIVAAVRDYFPWGAGLASFREVFPAYRDPACGMYGVWDRAHNVYAEGLISLGVIMPILTVILVGYLIVVFARGVRRRKALRYAGCLGLAGLLLVAIHSAVDFSLQIPGFAMFFAAFLAPLVTIAMRPPGGGSHQRSGRRRKAQRISQMAEADPF